MNKNYYAILMAGGVGSRFWPVSTTEFPKQFHDMLGAGSTLIQKTFSRLSKLIPAENILILTNERYNDLVLEQLPMVKQEQVLLEPAMRNTAPCILYASLKIQKKIQMPLWLWRQAITGLKMKRILQQLKQCF
jgi:mannose-1-phosphate guanylyltransferase